MSINWHKLMIPQEIVTQILDLARIEEVVGDVVQLKRRAANYMGRCPFHDERTPSFTVSPAKGIYKCFGCGAAGSTVKFVMDYEHLSYPDALKFLGKRYNVEVPEVAASPADRLAQQTRESLTIAADFVAKYYAHQLTNTDEGRSIGLSYFKERGFTEDMVRKFGLGYAPQSSDDLLRAAQQAGYSSDILLQLGVLAEKDGRRFAFFRQRVQFAIHDVNGKVVAFAGRTLSKDTKTPKYVNSPETDIYHKSRVLYGMHLAKKSIARLNECLLVEGYTDVISLVQGGIENVVASAGTSLTIEQIRLIRRYTPNIIILYDGDAAGIKAALRGIDLVLEEGMNVKIVLLPAPEDPDSYMKRVGKTAFEQYIHQQAQDFVLFKTNLLLDEAGNDPIKKAELIHQIMATIAVVPDPIKRQLYTQQCSELLRIEQQLLINEINKLRLKKHQKQTDADHTAADPTQATSPKLPAPLTQHELQVIAANQLDQQMDTHERQLLCLMLEFGMLLLDDETPVGVSIVYELEDLPPRNETYQRIVNLYRQQLEKGWIPESDFFVNYPDDPALATTVVGLLLIPHSLSERWVEHKIYVPDRRNQFKTEVFDSVNRYKVFHWSQKMDDLEKQITNTPHAQTDTINQLQLQHQQYKRQQMQLCKLLNVVIVP